jgi:single-strand DNA-binding protein
MEVRGRVHKVMNTEEVTATFKKRVLVLMIESGQYPQYPSFEFAQDRTSLLDGTQPGEEVEVSFDLNGREWTSPQGEVKYFTTLRGYNIKKVELAPVNAGSYTPAATQPRTAPAQQQPAYAAPAQGDPLSGGAANLEGDDDLPF